MVNARALLAYGGSADRFTLATMSEAMKRQFGLIKRPWGIYYLKDKTTGEQTSLKTRDPEEAQRLLQAVILRVRTSHWFAGQNHPPRGA